MLEEVMQFMLSLIALPALQTTIIVLVGTFAAGRVVRLIGRGK